MCGYLINENVWSLTSGHALISSHHCLFSDTRFGWVGCQISPAVARVSWSKQVSCFCCCSDEERGGEEEILAVISCSIRSLISCGFLSIPLKITQQCCTTWHAAGVALMWLHKSVYSPKPMLSVYSSALDTWMAWEVFQVSVIFGKVALQSTSLLCAPANQSHVTEVAGEPSSVGVD